MQKNVFNTVQIPRVDSNGFDLTHDFKLSFKMGQLIPAICMDCIPGDRFSIRPQNMLRLMPMVAPVMHRIRVSTHAFFVPTRILWPEWEKWVSRQSTAEAPYVQLSEGSEVMVGSLADYLGIPTGTYPGPLRFSPLQFAAYLKIWNEWYRSEQLQDEYDVTIVPGDNTAAFVSWLADSPAKRAWAHDYFTSCLPDPQEGTAVQIPLTIADDQVVEYKWKGGTESNNAAFLRKSVDGTILGTDGTMNNSAGPSPIAKSMHTDGAAVQYDPNGSLTVDVQADAVTINTLRRAFRLQEWLELLNRVGTRFTEFLMGNYGVKSSDARLQRPEMFGSMTQNMVISEVLSTAQSSNDASDAEVAVGSMAGHGISVGGGETFRYSCEEHGFLFVLVSVLPDTAYQQGLHRQWTRFDPLDYALPMFANIGEQAVKQKEINAQSNTPEADFGYIPRYSEYKYWPSRVAGQMRTTLSDWHMGRIFEDDPALNEDFIASDPTTRIFAVTDETQDHILAHFYYQINSVRKLPRFGVPQI